MFVPWYGHRQVMSALLKKCCQILQLLNSSQTTSQTKSQKNLLLINATVFRTWEILRPQIATCWHLCSLLCWAFPVSELTCCRKLMFHTLLGYVCLCLNGLKSSGQWCDEWDLCWAPCLSPMNRSMQICIKQMGQSFLRKSLALVLLQTCMD